MGGHSPAHDDPRVGIDDEAYVDDSGPGRHERQVGDPQLVGRGRSESVLKRSGWRGWLNGWLMWPAAALQDTKRALNSYLDIRFDRAF
jgi:hypothetical protein